MSNITDSDVKDSGVEVIKSYLSSLSNSSGVYRMIDAQGFVLYVGKAKNLKKRVSQYTNLYRLSPRILKMIEQTSKMEFVVTESEAQALLLENSLIKSLRPKYNILLRDDKSFPLIKIGVSDEFPGIYKYRGIVSDNNRYFGPFASVSDMYQTIEIIQKIFKLRTCSNVFYKSRKRPCMLYEIKKCDAPCVGFISKNDYRVLVNQAIDFLSGKNQKLQEDLRFLMNEHAERLEFEKAKDYRDKIQLLTRMQTSQSIIAHGFFNADVIMVSSYEVGSTVRFAVGISFFRNGFNYGTKVYYPSKTEGLSKEQVIDAFLGQFYSDNITPEKIYINNKFSDKKVFEELFFDKFGIDVKIIDFSKLSKYSSIRESIELTIKNSISIVAADTNNFISQFKKLALLLGLAQIKRVEVFDNSHNSGEFPIGVMIVATEEGFAKKYYRKFNMDRDKNRNNDDFAMMKEMLERRFKGAKDAEHENLENMPDLLLIDGGKAQLSKVIEVLRTYKINNVLAVGVAKGENRNAGEEKLYLPDNSKAIVLPKDSPLLFFIQNLRDEAHRFAIGSYRRRKEKSLIKSKLDEIEGIGAHRKKILLTYFGSVQEIARASLEDLQLVKGIDEKIAKNIYEWFR